jgi:hypothetical protein
MILTPITKIAQSVWDNLPGDDYRDKAALFGPIMSELRTIKLQAEVAHRAARAAQRLSRPPRKTTRTAENTVAKAIGKTMSQVQGMSVEICGVNIDLTSVFAIAVRPAHPLHTACVAFLDTHNIALVTAPKRGPGITPRMIVRKGGEQ